MSGQIFISYRREESRWSARSLRDRLCGRSDPRQIFMDIDAIALSEDFVQAIEITVAKFDVLLAVIGNNWLTSNNDHGNGRLGAASYQSRKGLDKAIRDYTEATRFKPEEAGAYYDRVHRIKVPRETC